MAITKTPSVATFPVNNVAQEDSPTRYAGIPTPTQMRSTVLFGIPLRSFLTGEEVQDSAIQLYIDQAISEIEHALDIYITPVTFEERHDYNKGLMANSWGYMKVKHTPILNVEKYQLTFNNGLPSGVPLVDIPLEFIHTQSDEGTIQLVPAQGVSISGLIVSIYSGLGFHAFNTQMISHWPGAVLVRYTAGFEKDKIPALLAGLIGNMAAYKFLSSLGPILFPTNSTSISIDGVSQSVGTLGPAYLQNRLSDLEKMIQSQMDTARGYYQKKFLIEFL